MSHIHLYAINGWHWLGVDLGEGRLRLITRLGRVGECIRP